MIASGLYFAVCAVALLVTDRIARRSADEVTITDLFDRVLTSRTIRLAVLVCWWWLGWHFLAGQTVDG
ncbi:DUF6186 family protein [Ruania albidiflava]|uniref:DUF6186 family protein n=1 Tax=Ruania albidiflava TaxID=366586 RepID=UPI0003B5AD90|nr:DUF6186 family protein [Ruania albidiflava]